MQKDSKSGMSRREFARRAALASAAVSIAPAEAFTRSAALPAPGPQQPAISAELPAPSRAEADARLQSILGQFGSRFSDDQKTELKRLCGVTQLQLDRLRAFHLENGDGPALYLKPLLEREKKSAPSHLESTPPAGASSVPKKS
jgi:hypothetical protein